MISIKEIAELIRDELEDAEHYATLCMRYKDDGDQKLADSFFSIGQQEIGHITTLHSQAVRLINEYKQSGKPAPEAMQAVWNWEHDRILEHKALIMSMFAMYK